MTENSSTKKTANEMFESLTGFDEIAIAKHFGSEAEDLRHKPTTFMRALVFVDKRRDGMSDIQAKQAAMEMSIREALEAFDYETEGDLEAGEG